LHLFPISVTSYQLSVIGESDTSEEQVISLPERFPGGVRYAPSCQILHHLQQRRYRGTWETPPFFAIQNPTEDLRYTEVEVNAIRKPFDPHTYILKNKQASKTAFNSPETLTKLRESVFAHFSCHGAFDSENPLNSALILAEDTSPTDPPERQELTLRNGRRFDTTTQGLTLQEIYANLDLFPCRLVMLSACESGLISTRNTDEYIGLASGFLYAGAESVVSSFWCVDDFATAFLAIRFYWELEDDIPIAIALQRAQNWLKTVSRSDFLHWLKADLKLPEEAIAQYQIRLRRFYSADAPFAPPQYWAAFGTIGL
ncbi:MAG: CHAT domain-containing protein, partial [Spirulina sp.]